LIHTSNGPIKYVLIKDERFTSGNSMCPFRPWPITSTSQEFIKGFSVDIWLRICHDGRAVSHSRMLASSYTMGALFMWRVKVVCEIRMG
jgi:hypothetical protein